MLRVEQHKGFGNDLQPSSSFQVSGRQQSNDYDKVNSNLEEFVKYFVKEFEAKLHAYHMILEGEVKKSGKFSDTFSGKIGQGVGGAAGGLVGLLLGSPALGVKLGAEAGEAGGKKLGSKIGDKQHKKKITSLLGLVDLSQKDKAKFRIGVVEAGFDVFQSFEMQFMRVTTDQGPKKAIQQLAKDATNRAINYIKKKDASITEGVIFGESKREGVSSISSGFEIKYEYLSNKKIWSTTNLYDKVGMLVTQKNKPCYYKKKSGSDTGKYGYRRLLISEGWGKLERDYEPDNIVESKSMQFTDYNYILDQKALEQKVESILCQINSNDKDLEEDRVKKILEEVRDSVIEEVNALKRQSHQYAEDRKILVNVEANLKNVKIDEYLRKFKQDFEEVKQGQQKIVKSIEIGQEENRENFNQLSQKEDIHHYNNEREHKKTQAGVENANQGINNLQEVLVEHRRKLDYILMSYNDLMKSKLEHINLPTDGKDKISQEVTKLHDAVSAGKKKDVETLLKGKVEVNAKTVDSLITPLHIAAQNGNRKIVDDLLNVKNIDVNAKTQQGATPLHYAAKNGHKEIVEALLNKCARVDVKTSNDYFTPLHHAAENGYKEIVELLLNKGAKINRTNKQGATALHLAAGNGYKEVVEYLLERKDIAIDVKTAGDECTPLYHAAQNGRKEVVKALLSMNKGVNVNAENFEGNTPLHVAVNCNHVDVVKAFLLNKDASVNKTNEQGATPLHYAAQNNHTGVVKALLEASNIDVNVKTEQEGATPLYYAVQNNCTDVVKVLLEMKGIDVDAECKGGTAPLHYAAKSGYEEIVRSLLGKKGVNVDIQDRNGLTPLHCAAYSGYIGAAEALLKKDANVDFKSTRGSTPLHIAVQSGHTDMVKYLLKKGALVNEINDTDGATPLHYAAESGYEEIVKCLLDRCAKVDVKTKNNKIPLDYATNDSTKNILRSTTELFTQVKKGDLQKVKDCLSKGAVVNAQGTDGGRPLHYAAWKDYVEITEVLLKNGANPNATGKNGCMPLHYAVQFGNFKIVQLLLENQADPNIQDDNGKTPLDLAQARKGEESRTGNSENSNSGKIVDALNRQMQSPGTSQSKGQLPKTTGRIDNNPETYLSDVTAKNQQRPPHL